MKIAALKIEQKRLGISDIRYRALLAETAGVASSRELDESGRKKVYSRLRSMGTAHSRSARFFWVLWNELQPFLDSAERSGAWCCGFIHRAANVQLDDLTCLDGLDKRDMHKAIEAIKLRLAHEKSRMEDVPF